MKWSAFWVGIVCFSALASGIYGQVTDPATANNADNEDRAILMRNEFSGGGVLHSAGWGITLRRAIQKTVKQKRYIELDIVSMKDPKEVRSQNPYYENAKSFIYGKVNSFIVPRIGVGRQNVLFAKAHTTGVEVRYHYGFGASLGLTRPVYLNILEDTGNPYEKNVVVEKYDPLRHTPDVIFGNASFTYGFDEIKFHPGGYIKSGVSFEYAKYQDQIWSIETGVVLDVYPDKIPIMAFIENKQVFLNFYISLSYGGKW